MKTRLNTCLITLALGCSIGTVQAQTSLAYVADNVLGEQRGRYLDAGQIVNFGIQLVSTWTSPDGSKNGVAAVLSGAPGFTPNLTAYRLDAATAQTASSRPPQGLMSVQGVGQVNQIAGSANTSNNSADILVSTQPVNTAAPTAPGPNWQEANAGMAGVTLHDNQLRIEINKGAAGNSFQNIGQGQVLQFTRIQGNNMAVENSLQIQIGVRPDLSTQQQLAMQSYHSMLTGMR